eukprot:c26032_g1_i1 orf=79-1737(-)
MQGAAFGSLSFLPCYCCHVPAPSWSPSSLLHFPTTNALHAAVLRIGCIVNKDYRKRSSRKSIAGTELFEVSPGGGGKLSVCASLGFTANPRIGIERAADGLLKDAASLLVYQEVLRSPPSQAFLKVILCLRRGEDGWKILEAFGEFYRLMAMGHHPSWEDFILDGILAGEGNPFAEAAANVGNPRCIWSGCVAPSLQAAAAADLDSLQRLSIAESTLVGWVADLATDVRQEWRTAAELTLSSCAIRKVLPSSLDERRNSILVVDNDQNMPDLGSDIGPEDFRSNPDRLTENYDNRKENEDIKLYKQDMITCEREKWHKKIGGLWRWSEAVPLLEKYYAGFGTGKITFAQAFRYKGGKLIVDKYCTHLKSCCDLSIHNIPRDILIQNFRKHASGSIAHHVIVCGPGGSGKTWLVKSVLDTLACQGEVKVVILLDSDLKNLTGLLEELAIAWQRRFVIMIDLSLKGGEDRFYTLKSAIDGSVQVICKVVLQSSWWSSFLEGWSFSARFGCYRWYPRDGLRCERVLAGVVCFLPFSVGEPLGQSCYWSPALGLAY